jgi:hypothetical protein
MARLPSSFRKRNRTSKNFREQYAKLPENIQDAVRDGCRLFDRDPDHPSFRPHALEDRKKAQHISGSVSIAVNMQYRAIYVKDGDVNVWYWIGTHAEYKVYTASKK